MESIVYGIGIGAGGTLIAMLLATLAGRRFRIWPTPGEKTWQSYVFWPLFRGLNVLCFTLAVIERNAPPLFNLPASVRALAVMMLMGSIGLFAFAFVKLGRDNSYGAQHGLVTAGIYQWSRNPQNAMLIAVYGALALATNTPRVAVLCAAMMAVYALMVLCEEPWLEGVYGEAYRRYCRDVPRFFHWRKLFKR